MSRVPLQLPDLESHTEKELLKIGEDFLSYSDEQWHQSWDEADEASRYRARALTLGFMALRVLGTQTPRGARFHRASWEANDRFQHHQAAAMEFRSIAEEAETASAMVFEQAEQRHIE